MAQIERLMEHGCDIVRLAVPDKYAGAALKDIRARTDAPLVADIHFDYRLALMAAEAEFDCLRINPGNIGGRENVEEVVRACKDRDIPIRIGVNSGSIQEAWSKKFDGRRGRRRTRGPHGRRRGRAREDSGGHELRPDQDLHEVL